MILPVKFGRKQAAPVAPDEDIQEGASSVSCGFAPADTHLRCSMCGGIVSAEKVRCTSKRAGFKCDRCLVKTTQLRREYGNWPPKWLNNVDQKAKEEFYQNAGKLFSKKEVKELADS